MEIDNQKEPITMNAYIGPLPDFKRRFRSGFERRPNITINSRRLGVSLGASNGILGKLSYKKIKATPKSKKVSEKSKRRGLVIGSHPNSRMGSP